MNNQETLKDIQKIISKTKRQRITIKHDSGKDKYIPLMMRYVQTGGVRLNRTDKTT